MTVKELMERLSQFDDDLQVLVWDESLRKYRASLCMARGFNEMDGALLLDTGWEDDGKMSKIRK